MSSELSSEADLVLFLAWEQTIFSRNHLTRLT